MSLNQTIKGKTILFLLLRLLLCFRECLCVQEFEIQPSDVTVKRAESVSLPCKIKNQKGVVQWTKNGFGLGTDRDLKSYQRYMMLGTNDTGNYTLHITTALLSDEDEYQCQVSSAANESALRSKTVKLTVLYPPKDDESEVFVTPDKTIEAISGATVRITCRGGLSKPLSTITWEKDNVTISNSQYHERKEKLPSPSRLESVTSYIDIKPDNSYHNSTITCTVKHTALDNPIVRSVKINVQYAPIVTIAKHFIKAREGDDVKYTCSAKGNPSNLRYRWEVNGLSVTGDYETEFTIKGISRIDHKSVISCVVSNTVGNGRAQKTLMVHYEPVFTEEPVDVDANSGSSVRLKCKVDSNPTPEIVWTHEDSQKVIGHGTEWSLTVDGSTKGRYRCRIAVPGFPEISRSMEVFMRGPPLVLPNQVSYGVEGDRSSLECKIESIPRPTEVQWRRNGRTLDPTSLSKYDVEEISTSSGIRSILQIYDSLDSDFGVYNCTAKNSYGFHSDFVELNKRQSLPMVTTLVAIIGGAIFIVIVVIIVFLFRKQGKPYKDSDLEKQTNVSSTQGSVLKTDSRTATGSDMSPSEDDGDYSHDEDWDTSDTANTVRNINRENYRYSQEFGDISFPPKTSNTSGAGYIPYVDYNRDYNPPPPINYNRNSIYNPLPMNNVDPRYSAAYGNPYLRVPQTARVAQQNIYGSNTLLEADHGNINSIAEIPAAPPVENYQNNNLNNVNNKKIYSQLNQRNNNVNSQYVMLPLADGQKTVLGTHI